MTEALSIPDDFFHVAQVAEAHPRAYYNEYSGEIIGVSMSTSDLDSSWPHIEIVRDLAELLLTGGERTIDYHVGSNADGDLVLRRKRDEKLWLTAPRVDLAKLGEEFSNPSPVEVTFAFSRAAPQHIIVNCRVDEKYQVNSLVDTLELLVTNENFGVAARVSLDLRELLSQGTTQLSFAADDETVYDIVMALPLGMAGRVVRVADFAALEESLLLELPVGTPDIMLVDGREALPNEGCLVVAVGAQSITVTLQNGGGARYNRTLAQLVFYLCQPGDVFAVLGEFRIDVRQLESLGEVIVDLPCGVANSEFEIYTRLYYSVVCTTDKRFDAPF